MQTRNKEVASRYSLEARLSRLAEKIRDPKVHCIVTDRQTNVQPTSVPEGKFLLRIIVSPSVRPWLKKHPLRAYLKPTDLWLVDEEGGPLGHSHRLLQEASSSPDRQGRSDDWTVSNGCDPWTIALKI